MSRYITDHSEEIDALLAYIDDSNAAVEKITDFERVAIGVAAELLLLHDKRKINIGDQIYTDALVVQAYDLVGLKQRYLSQNPRRPRSPRTTSSRTQKAG